MTGELVSWQYTPMQSQHACMYVIAWIWVHAHISCHTIKKPAAVHMCAYLCLQKYVTTCTAKHTESTHHVHHATVSLACRHELLPCTHAQTLLLLQTDISARAELEMRMAALTETQLTMLEQVRGACLDRWKGLGGVGLGWRACGAGDMHGSTHRGAAHHCAGTGGWALEGGWVHDTLGLAHPHCTSS